MGVAKPSTAVEPSGGESRTGKSWGKGSEHLQAFKQEAPNLQKVLIGR